MPIQEKSRVRGISILEVLIALAVLAIVFSFTSTTFSSAAHKKELLIAAENVDFSIRNARSLARERETGVLVHFNGGSNNSPHSVTFAAPHLTTSMYSDGTQSEFVLPDDIRLLTGQSVIRFDRRGLLEAPIKIELVSTKDANLKETLWFE